jgi:serine/threonine protein kinase
MPPPGSWPLASDFSKILQRPDFAFRDKELKQLTIEKDGNGQPRPRAGRFANVYKGTYSNGKGSVAVRVFTSAAAERRERYQAIHDYLRNRKLASLVGFTYTDDGVRSGGNGKWYPLVTMEWVPGETLYEWLRGKCLEKNRQAVARVSDLWLELIRELSAAKIAHGDLQHANVMISGSGQFHLKLVDYDCMCVPSLVGRRNLEIGVDPYQHPDRNDDTPLSASLDNFSALFIFVALKALAAAPDLWNTFVERPQYDKLLFRREDFDEPRSSALIQALQRSPDPEVGRLTRQLVELTRVEMDQVPRLEEVLFSFASVEVLLNQRDFDGAVDLLARNKKRIADAPPPLQPRLREAEERIKHRVSLEQAVDSGNEAAMQRLYLPKFLDDYPKAQRSVAVAKLAGQVIPILECLREAEQAKSWRRFVQLWDLHRNLLAERKSAAAFQLEANAWRERNLACDALLKLVAQRAADSGALAAAWERLSQLGGHPDAEPHRAAVEKVVGRERAWTAFEKTPRAESEAGDAAVVNAWNESLFAGWDKAERQRPRVTRARERLKRVQELGRAASRPMTLAAEEDLLKIAQGISGDYDYALRPRVELARKRLELLRHLTKALREPASDLAVAEIHHRLAETQGQPLVPPEWRARIALAANRAAFLIPLKLIPPDYPPRQAPQFDPQILAAWPDELLRDCHDAQPWRAAYQAAARRKAVLAKLKVALARSDKVAIADLGADDCLRGYPLSREQSRAVKLAVAEVRMVRELLAALGRNDRSRFRDAFDAGLVRQNAATFAPHKPRLCEWIRDEILPADRLGLAFPTARKGLVEEPGADAAYRVCWNWPDPRFSELCTVALCPSEPVPGDDPREMQTHLRMRIDRKSYEEGGGSRLIHVEKEWLGAYVIVWSVVNVGFQEFASEPLVLGRVEGPSRKGWGNMFG